MIWIYDAGLYRQDTVERLASEALRHLRALIAHCLEGEAPGHTPTDFPHAGLEQGQLDRLLGRIGRAR